MIGNYEKIDDMKLQETFVEQGKLLHRKRPVVDMHLDLAGEMLLRHQLGEQNVLYYRYLPAFWQAGIRLLASSVYVANCDLDHAWANALMQIELIKGEIVTCNVELANRCRSYVESAELANRCCGYGEYAGLADRCRGYGEYAGLANRCCGYVHSEKSGHADRSCRENGYMRVRLVKAWQDIEQVLQGNELGILLYMEGLDCIGEDLDKLDELHAQGVRGAALTWSRPDALANGCCKASEYRQITGGLTQTGKRAVKRLEALSMFLDVSHLNDDGFADVVRIAERPFAATHSNSRQVYDNYRNLTEDQLKKLGEQGGVAGLNGCQYIAGSKAGNHLDMLCRHVEHEVLLIGAEHVGFGFDLCDPYDEARAALDELKRQTKEAQGASGVQGTSGVRVVAKAKEQVLHELASNGMISGEICSNRAVAAAVASIGNSIRERDDCLMSHVQIPLITAALLQRGMKEADVVKLMGGSWLAYLKKVLV